MKTKVCIYILTWVFMVLAGLLAVPGSAYALWGQTVATGEAVNIANDPSESVLAGGWRVALTAEHFPGVVGAAGADVSLSGQVDGDVHLFGQDVKVSGILAGALAAAGQNVTLSRDSKVEGALWLAGQTVRLNGSVPANGHVLANRVVIEGEVRPAKEDQVLEIQAQEIDIRSGAKIYGPITHRGGGQLRVDNRATMGVQITSEPQTIMDDFKHKAKKVGGWLKLGGQFMLVLWLLIAGMFVSLVMTAKMRGSLAQVRQRPGRMALLGLGYMIGVPVAAVMLFLTVVGIPVAVSMLASYPLIIIMGFAAGVLWLGTLVFELVTGRRPRRRHEMFISYLVAMPVVLVLTRIPYIGLLGWFVPLVSGLGALAWLRWQQFHAGKA